MRDDKENRPPIDSEDIPIDIGIFNLVVSWYQSLAAENGAEYAARYVSSYLLRLADGITSHQIDSDTEKDGQE